MKSKPVSSFDRAAASYGKACFAYDELSKIAADATKRERRADFALANAHHLRDLGKAVDFDKASAEYDEARVQLREAKRNLLRAQVNRSRSRTLMERAAGDRR
jgi:hypothetical protein